MRNRRQETERQGRRRMKRVALSALLVLLAASSAQAAGDLVLIPEIEMLTVMIGLFVVLIFPVNALIFKPIFHALDEREGRITGARTRARRIDEEASVVLERYEAQIREARQEAELGRKAQLASARGEQVSVAAAARAKAEAQIDQARSELQQSLEQARTGLRESSQDLARTAAAQILGRPL